MVQQGTERNPQPTALPSVLHSAWPWPSSFLLTERAARNSDNTAPGAKKRSFTHSPREVVCGSREQQGARNRGGGPCGLMSAAPNMPLTPTMLAD